MLKLDAKMLELAEQLKDEQSLLVFGRGYNYATALEAALKVGSWATCYLNRHSSLNGVQVLHTHRNLLRTRCNLVDIKSLPLRMQPARCNSSWETAKHLTQVKEVALMHSEGILAGEMKHGPLALVDERLPIIVVATRDRMRGKMLSVLQQLRARGAQLIVLCNEGDADMEDLCGKGCRLIQVRAPKAGCWARSFCQVCLLMASFPGKRMRSSQSKPAMRCRCRRW